MKWRRRRWSDNERRFGPFTFSRDPWTRYGFMFDTGDDDGDGSGNGASVRAYLRRWTFIVCLPSLLRIGREYGAFLSEGTVHMHYGPQTFESWTTRSKCWFVPWLNWRHVRTSVYGLDGAHHATHAKGQPFLDWFPIERACPTRAFEFKDFDGERIVARARIEEREWRFGTGWCAWLSAFRRPNVRRYLNLNFSKETGPKKGSWKGGVVGSSIEMQPGELHEAAFRRYCAGHQMAFVGVASEDARVAFGGAA